MRRKKSLVKPAQFVRTFQGRKALHGKVLVTGGEHDQVVGYPLLQRPKFKYDLVIRGENKNTWIYVCSTNYPKGDQMFNAYVSACVSGHRPFAVVHAESGWVQSGYIDNVLVDCGDVAAAWEYELAGAYA